VDRQTEALRLAEELLADIELGRLGVVECVLKGSRLARLVSDDDVRAWLEYELHGYDKSALADEYMIMTGRWSGRRRDKAYFVPLSRLRGTLLAAQRELTSLQGATFSGEFALSAQQTYNQRLDEATEIISTFEPIDSGVRATLYDFATRTYHELLFSEIQADLFSSVRSEIDSYLGPASGNSLQKIDSINERLRAGDIEAISHAMTTCRRLIDAVADAVYPASAEGVEVDGQQLAVDKSKVLNRLSAFAYSQGTPKGRRTRLNRGLRDIYDRVSKGVHADISADEAKFVFIQTYLLLGELLMLESSGGEFARD
jgi:hypothetical protein